MIYLYQQTTEWFRHIAKVIFSRNFAHVKFRENKTLAKITKYTVFIPIMQLICLFATLYSKMF